MAPKRPEKSRQDGAFPSYAFDIRLQGRSCRGRKPINPNNMKQINWRHGVLLVLMAVGLCLVGCDVESEAAFWINKLLGLAVLAFMYRLHERWWRQGKIAKYRIR